MNCSVLTFAIENR